MTSKKVVLFGECMIELKQTGETSNGSVYMAQGFAGDVFNAAVYLKRWFKHIDTSLFTALGVDEFSNSMKEYFKSEQLNNDLVLTSEDKIPGLYSIKTDEHGERSFTYWRSDAAARYAMDLVNEETIERLKQADMFFFSGISLAVLKPSTREVFWKLLWQLKESGVSIAFDPNYRARLWTSVEDTKLQYDLALQVSDIVMPGIEDFELIYGHKTFADVKAFCQPYKISELVIKDGPNGVMVIADKQKHFIEVTPVKRVVDTTSAGDSFNGAYLGARLSNMDVVESVNLAAKTAGYVIQHTGAIVEQDKFNQFVVDTEVEG